MFLFAQFTNNIRFIQFPPHEIWLGMFLENSLKLISRLIISLVAGKAFFKSYEPNILNNLKATYIHGVSEKMQLTFIEILQEVMRCESI